MKAGASGGLRLAFAAACLPHPEKVGTLVLVGGGGLEALFRTPGSGQDSEISAACFGLCISGHTPEFAYGAKARCKLSRFCSKCSFVAGIWACSLDMSTTDS